MKWVRKIAMATLVAVTVVAGGALVVTIADLVHRMDCPQGMAQKC